MSDDSDGGKNAPLPFFFNGEELCGWSSQWHLCGIGEFLNNFVEDPTNGWDEFVGYRHIWHLQCRLDHVGSIESEDPAIFHVCSQEVLRVLLANRETALQFIETSKNENTTSREIFGHVVEGIGTMLELCNRERCAMWTSGNLEDRKRLVDSMRRSKLSREHSDFCAPPHERQRRSEQIARAGTQLSGLRALSQNGNLDKRLRQIIHGLPKM